MQTGCMAPLLYLLDETRQTALRLTQNVKSACIEKHDSIDVST